MFLFIFEDGSMKKVPAILDEDLVSADNGCLDIVSMQLCKQYYNGEWHEIEEA